MMEPTTPLPTTTASTGFNFVFDILFFPAVLGWDMLRKALRIDRHPAGLDVEHADGFGVVWLTAGDQVAVFAGGQSGESKQLPPNFVAVAAIQRIGEVAFLGIPQ